MVPPTPFEGAEALAGLWLSLSREFHLLCFNLLLPAASPWYLCCEFWLLYFNLLLPLVVSKQAFAFAQNINFKRREIENHYLPEYSARPCHTWQGGGSRIGVSHDFYIQKHKNLHCKHSTECTKARLALSFKEKKCGVQGNYAAKLKQIGVCINV